mmetsp:Transcript_7864/g.18176  ORF Transcript_7864/g.18176 Transcript_7864/m.18176 type:complete len:222 (-) Transcript_7864:1215-1880(-)
MFGPFGETVQARDPLPAIIRSWNERGLGFGELGSNKIEVQEIIDFRFLHEVRWHTVQVIGSKKCILGVLVSCISVLENLTNVFVQQIPLTRIILHIIQTLLHSVMRKLVLFVTASFQHAFSHCSIQNPDEAPTVFCGIIANLVHGFFQHIYRTVPNGNPKFREKHLLQEIHLKSEPNHGSGPQNDLHVFVLSLDPTGHNLDDIVGDIGLLMNPNRVPFPSV